MLSFHLGLCPHCRSAPAFLPVFNLCLRGMWPLSQRFSTCSLSDRRVTAGLSRSLCLPSAAEEQARPWETSLSGLEVMASPSHLLPPGPGRAWGPGGGLVLPALRSTSVTRGLLSRLVGTVLAPAVAAQVGAGADWRANSSCLLDICRQL